MSIETVYLLEIQEEGYYVSGPISAYDVDCTPNPDEAKHFITGNQAAAKGKASGRLYRVVEMRVITENEIARISEWTSALIQKTEKKAIKAKVEKITHARSKK